MAHPPKRVYFTYFPNFLYLLAIFSPGLWASSKGLTKGIVIERNAFYNASWEALNNAYHDASRRVGTHVSALTEHGLTWPPE